MDHFCKKVLQMWTELVHQGALGIYFVDVMIWKVLMDKMFVEWSLENMDNGKPCRLRDSYTQTSHKVAMSLW